MINVFPYSAHSERRPQNIYSQGVNEHSYCIQIGNFIYKSVKLDVLGRQNNPWEYLAILFNLKSCQFALMSIDLQSIVYVANLGCCKYISPIIKLLSFFILTFDWQIHVFHAENWCLSFGTWFRMFRKPNQ